MPSFVPDFRSWLRARLAWIAALVLLLLHAVLAWAARSPAILTNGDDARYFLLARSLRQFGYANVWELGAPLQRDYPPAYPALLSLWGALHGDNYDLLLLVGIASSVAALFLLFVSVKRLWSSVPAVLCLLVLFANPNLLLLAGELRPESLYMALSLVVLAVAATPTATGGHRFLAGSAAIVAALSRGLGVALLIALGLYWLKERRFRAAAVLTVLSAATVGWWLYISLLAPGASAGGTYRGHLSIGMEPGVVSIGWEVARRVTDHLPFYLGRTIPNTFMLPAVPGTIVDNLLIGGAVTLTGFTGLYLLYKRWPVAAYYLIAYGGLLAIWPWHSRRMVAPILPLIAAAMLLGGGAIAERMSHRLRTPAMWLLALALTVHAAQGALRLVDRAGQCKRGSIPPDDSCLSADQRSFFQALEFVNHELPDGAVFFAWRAEPFYLYAARTTLNRRRAQEALSQIDSLGLEPLAREGVTHLLLSRVRPEELRVAEQLERRCSELALLKAFGRRTLLFEIVEPGREPMEGAACRALAGYRQAATDPTTGLWLRDFQLAWPPPAEAAVAESSGLPDVAPTQHQR